MFLLFGFAFFISFPSFGQGLTFDPATGAALDEHHQKITLTFGASAFSNVPDVKPFVRGAADGVHFDALDELDSAWIAGGTLHVRFATMLTSPALRLKIVGGALRDAYGTVLATECETGTLDASGAITPVPDEASEGVSLSTASFSGQTVRTMECGEGLIVLQMPGLRFTLPAAEINIESVRETLGSEIAYRHILVTLRFARPSSDDEAKIVQSSYNPNEYTVVVKPIDCDIVCTGNADTVDVSRFNGYIERTVLIPDGIDPSKITSGIVLNEDGTFSHVPTAIVMIDGRYYAKINSLTNRVSPSAPQPGGAALQSVMDVCNTPPWLAADLGMTAVQATATVITNTRLAAMDQEQPASAITYTLRAAPIHGRLERASAPGVSILSFTQAEIDGGIVRYVNTDALAAADTLSFTLTDGDGGESGVNTFAIALSSPTLPVTLERFSALRTSGSVLLSWHTATEVNNFGFEVEKKQRASDPPRGDAWRRVGFIEGHGTAASPHDYSFCDEKAGGDALFYRLKQIDRDGAYGYSPELMLKEEGTPRDFALGQNYPNPFNPSTKIPYAIPRAGHVKLSLYDMLGREAACLVDAWQEAGSYIVTVDASAHSAGMYFYTLHAGAYASTKKLVIAK